MKKIIISCFVSLLFSITVFAQETLTLQLDRQQVEVGETFSLHLEISNTSDTEVDKVDIVGLDDFIQMGQSRSTKMVMINGKTQISVGVDILLEAKKEGSFTLGPAKMSIGKDTIASNTVTIQVVPATGYSQTQDENTFFDEEKELSDTLYDVKPPQNSFSFASLFFYSVILLLFIVIFYYAILFFLNQKKTSIPVKKIQEEKVQAVPEDKRLYFKKAIKKLASESLDLDRSIFFSRLNTLYREFLVFKGIPDALTFTLEDAKKYQKQKEYTHIISKFEESYYYEFKQGENVDQVKQKSISDFESLL